MNKKIEWIKRGMTANNGLHMQEVCDQIADATTAINNSLQKPITAPSATQIVTVDNTNTQTMLNIGDGLSVENGSLKASGGTGSKLYYKTITLDFLNESPAIPGVTEINIYFYESNNTLYDITNINTLQEKIPLAICNFKVGSQASLAPIWILGCMPHRTNLTFYCLRSSGEILEAPILLNEIDDTNISMYCSYTEV